MVSAMSSALRFVLKPKRSTGKGYNIHRSNRAKEGLFHGKDVRFGHSISHSHTRSKKKWLPNVINKRVFSYALGNVNITITRLIQCPVDDWVRFKMTTTALKAIDAYGGVDNYLLRLDERSVSASNYVTRVRNLIAARLFHRGALDAHTTRRLGFDKNPPPAEGNTDSEAGDDKENMHLA